MYQLNDFIKLINNDLSIYALCMKDLNLLHIIKHNYYSTWSTKSKHENTKI